MQEETRIPISCNKDCGAGCPLTAVVRNKTLIKVIDNPERGPYMHGCMKGYRVSELMYHPDRLLKPLIRTGRRGRGEFREADWGEALDLAAGFLEETIAESGPEGIIRIGGSGSCRGIVHNTAYLSSRFLALAGGYTDTAGNYSSEAVGYINPLMFGTSKIGIDIRTLEHSAFIILWGFNPADTRFGCETEAYLRRLRDQGIPMVVIDPRRTASTALCDAEWLPIFPGSDSALAAALIFLTLQDSPQDISDTLGRYSTGAGSLIDLITGRHDGQPRNPEWAARRCGLPAVKIIELYRKYVSARPAAILPGLSVQRTLGGEETSRFLALLQLITGNIGIPGGSPGAGQWNALPSPPIPAIPIPGNPTGLEVPVNLWADAVLQGKEGGYPSDISLVYNTGGNFAVQSSDSSKVLKALDKVNYIISHDFFLTPTCQWSDIIFPAAMFPERKDVCKSNSGLVFYSGQAVAPPEGVLTDYKIFKELADRLGFGPDFTGGKSADEWVDYLIDSSPIADKDDFRHRGIWESPYRMHVSFRDFIRDPEAYPLDTPSGKIEFTPNSFIEAGGKAVPDLSVSAVTNETFPLYLITPKEKFRIHSQYHEVPAMTRLFDDRLLMNPVDAAARGINTDDIISVTSRTGRVVLPVRVGDEIMPGVVAMKAGFWDTEIARDGNRYPGTNTLTSDESTYPSNGSRTHSNAVQVALLQAGHMA